MRTKIDLRSVYRVDLEDSRKKVETTELARRFFTRIEAKAVEESCDLERVQTFLHFWTLKEAALKSIGEGLPIGLDVFEFELCPDPRVIHVPPEHGEPGQYSACVIDASDSCAALVVRSLA